jgi:hypothetical protein
MAACLLTSMPGQWSVSGAVNCRAFIVGLRLLHGLLPCDLRAPVGLLAAGLIGGSLGRVT